MDFEALLYCYPIPSVLRLEYLTKDFYFNLNFLVLNCAQITSCCCSRVTIFCVCAIVTSSWKHTHSQLQLSNLLSGCPSSFLTSGRPWRNPPLSHNECCMQRLMSPESNTDSTEVKVQYLKLLKI